ncbi:hypothetical protein IQ241_01705 [Romeria aff. gracilis LEGE 07310]|uniref:Uncharacterized protein n=1 Tax=Vasconcelosia minhoensis LEGE 07310 TaxID=915328 RepID=A0A8J7AAR4_9CYAN|nr:hypothetical protein [Romeria gracilis]MBE9076019.1 hypothetical protein [Romeria aff. gracilis LEGE 07310]
MSISTSVLPPGALLLGEMVQLGYNVITKDSADFTQADASGMELIVAADYSDPIKCVGFVFSKSHPTPVKIVGFHWCWVLRKKTTLMLAQPKKVRRPC